MVERYVEDMRDLLRVIDDPNAQRAWHGLVDDYQWSYRAAFSSSANSDVKIMSGGISDPTGNVAGTKEQDRRELTRAARLIKAALTSLNEAESILNGLSGGRGDTRTGYIRMGSMVGKDDLEGARAAKRRRLQRKEGWGDG